MPVRRPNREVCIQQIDSRITHHPADYEILGEARARVGRCEPVGDIEVQVRLRIEGELIQVVPAISGLYLQLKDLTFAGHAIGAVWGILFDTRLKTYWRGRAATTSADIDDEAPLGKFDQGKSMASAVPAAPGRPM